MKCLNVDKRFIQKVINGSKVYSLRNSPIEIGEYIIDDKHIVEVLKSERKVILFMNKYKIGETLHFFEDINLDEEAPYLGYKEFGFNNNSEMIEFYKEYFNSSSVYLISFRVKNADMNYCESE